MKEIKFRAWDKNDGMFYDIQNGIEFSDLSHYTFKDFLGNPDAIGDYHKWKIMQYTGLKDKNGKEIYENDILSFKRRNSEVVEIKWKDDGFKCGVKTSDNCTTWYGLNHFLEKYQCEIIGNIYENPNLLK